MKSALPPRRGMAIGLAALAWLSILLQCFLSLQSAILSGKSAASGIVGFLGYFTVLTNLLVCISLTAPLISGSSVGKFFSRGDVTAGVATSILFVGLLITFSCATPGIPKDCNCSPPACCTTSYRSFTCSIGGSILRAPRFTGFNR